MHKIFLVLLALTALGGCAADPVWAPDAAVERAMYRHPGPPKITLYTMLSNDTGAGAHTSMMINASQRVIFDPSGSFHHESIPERNDVLFGATPQVADVYTRFHARKTYHVVVQELEVPAATAEKALQLALANGAVMNAFCAQSTAGILRQLPGMSGITAGMSPLKLSKQFGSLSGVKSRTLYEYDDDDNSKVLKDWDPALVKKK